jgi:hypothetical protein
MLLIMLCSYNMNLELDSINCSVCRRFSEFLRLRKELQGQLKGAIVPSLPRKNVMSRFDNEIIEYRKRGIIAFFNSLSRCPEKCQCPVLITFLMNPDVNDFIMVCDGLHRSSQASPMNDVSDWFSRSVQRYYSKQAWSINATNFLRI